MGIIIDIILAILLLYAVSRGAKKGGARGILELLSFVVTIITTMIFKDTITNAILELSFVKDLILKLSVVFPLPEEILNNPLIDVHTTKIATDIVTVVISVIGFVITYFVARFVLGLFIKIIDKIMSFPVLRTLNKLVGGVLGGVKFLIIVFVIMSLMLLLKDTSIYTSFNSIVADTYLTKWLYNNNFLFSLFK